MYSIGLDIGTTSVSGIVHDTKTGEILRSLTVPNDGFLKTPFPWARLQDPNRLVELAEQVLNWLLDGHKQVVSIGITGQMHGIVYLNRKGQPVSDLVIWQDGRGDLLYNDDLSYAEFITGETGYNVATGYGAVTYYYDSVNGLVPEDADVFCTIHDLVAMRLAGLKRPLVHPSDAASLGLFDLENGRFDPLAIKKLGLKNYMFPDVCRGNTVLGRYNGMPVSVAIGDNQASFLGSVSNMRDSILINVGTGGQVSCFSENVPCDGLVDCRPLVDKGYILAGSSLCGGRAYAMLEKLFREVAEAVTGCEVKSAYPAMDRITESFEGGDTLCVSTLFSGTRAEPQRRGSIGNIGVDNLNMAALCDGFMRGMVEELFQMYSEMRPYISAKPRFAVGSGNGIRNNPALRRRFEKLFGVPLIIPKHREEAAFGASLFALVAAGILPDLKSAGELIKYEE